MKKITIIEPAEARAITAKTRVAAYCRVSTGMDVMLRNNVELDLKIKFIEEGTTQTEIAESIGVSLPYVNRITKGREQIVNKTFVKMMDELGYDVELTYIKKG